MRLLIVAFALAALALVGVPHAQADEHYDWHLSYLSGDGNMPGVVDEVVDPSPASYNAGEDRWDHGTGGGAVPHKRIVIRFALPEGNEWVTRIRIQMNKNTCGTPSNDAVAVASGDLSIVATSGSHSQPGTGTMELDWEFPTPVFGVYIRLATNCTGSSSVWVRLLKVDVWGIAPPTGTFIMPIHPLDSPTPLGMRDLDGYVDSAFDLVGPFTSSAHTVAGYTAGAGRAVYAVTDGVISSIDNLYGWYDCHTTLFVVVQRYCVFPFGDYQGGFFIQKKDPVNPVISSIPVIGPAISLGDFVFNDVVHGYKVVLTSPTHGDFVYWLDRAPDYLRVGLEVQAGCQMGVTIPTLTLGLDTLPVTAQGAVNAITEAGMPGNSGVGVTAVTRYVDGARVHLFDDLTIAPLHSGLPCDQVESLQSCLGDAGLKNPSQWEQFGSVGFTPNGVTIAPGGEISRIFNLSAIREPRIEFRARSSSAGSVRVQMGTTTQIFQIPGGEPRTLEFAGAAHLPDIGGFYTVSLANTGGSIIEVAYICVEFTKDGEGEPLPPRNPPPPACYFYNASFAEGTGGWTVSSGVDSGHGEIHVQDGQTFSQPVTLHPGPEDPASYTITVKVAVLHFASYVPDETDTTGVITLEYAWPDASYATVGEPTLGDFARNYNLLTLSTSFSVSESDSGVMTFRVTLSNTPATVRGLAVREICLNPTDGPGWPEDPEGPGWDEERPEGPFRPNCEVISLPSGQSIGPWIYYHWSNLDNFFQCQLMTMLNDMYKVGMDGFRLLGWLGRWIIASALIFADYLNYQLVPYVGGLLGNSVGTTVIYEAEQQCANFDILCHLSSIFSRGADVIEAFFALLAKNIDDVIKPIVDFVLMILGLAFDLLFNIVASLVALAFTIIGYIVTLLQLGLQLIMSIFDAWNNSTPEGIPGLPACSVDPQSSPLCLFFWLAENTIFAGPGELIIPLITAILAILLTIWTVREIQRLIVQMGASL